MAAHTQPSTENRPTAHTTPSTHARQKPDVQRKPAGPNSKRPGAKKRGKRESYPVLSPQGKRDSRIVAAARITSNLAMGAGLVVLMHRFLAPSITTLLSGHAPTLSAAEVLEALWPTILLALLAALAAVTEIAYGGAAARNEEKRVRHKVLSAMYASRGRPTRDENENANLVTLMTDNAERMSEFRGAYLGATLAAITVPFLTLIYVSIAIDPVIGVPLLVACPLIPVLIAVFMRAFRKTSANSRRKRAELSGKYLDAIRNLVTIRLLGAGERVEATLREEGEKNRGAIMKLLAGNQIVIIVLDGLFSLALTVLATTLTLVRYHAGAITLAEALSVPALIVLLLEPLVQVAGFFYIGMGGIASQKALSRYLGRATKPLPKRGRALPAPEGVAIAAEGLSFNYGRGTVFSDVSFELPQGARVAFVGPSGAGKTTLLNVLRGSLALQSGGVNVAGCSYAEATNEQIAALSATLPQRAWLFTGTIADNLRLARPNATEEEMWQALEAAHIADEIRAMPDSLATDCGESGALISGGQAQRIALARVFLADRKVLFLDEPTSQVDMESQEGIIRALQALDSSWTIVMVTHRLELLKLADTVIQVRDGNARLLNEAEAHNYAQLAEELGEHAEGGVA